MHIDIDTNIDIEIDTDIISINKSVSRVQYVHNMEYYSGINIREKTIHTCHNMEDLFQVMLSKPFIKKIYSIQFQLYEIL